MKSNKKIPHHELLRRQFENQEAIYLSKGALRVQVKNIFPNEEKLIVSADIEEIPTVGLGVGSFQTRKSQNLLTPPQSWNISAGYKSCYSDHSWTMGYGGWSLHFGKNIVDGVVSIVSDWPNNINDTSARYKYLLDWINDNEQCLKIQKIFQ